jgi:hypothetical protein
MQPQNLSQNSSDFLLSFKDSGVDFARLGANSIKIDESDHSQIENEILIYFNKQEQDLQDKKQKFCQGLKAEMIEFAKDFTNNDDQKIERINKIINSLYIVKNLGHDLTKTERQNFSQTIGENYYKIHHLLDESFQSYLDEDSFINGIHRSFTKDSVFKKEIDPLLNLFFDDRDRGEKINPTLQQKFIKMIAKSLIKAPQFDEDLFNKCNSCFAGFDPNEKTIFITEMQAELLEKLDQSKDGVVDVSNCLKIYNSLQKDENFHQNFPNFKEKFFGKLGGAKELLHENTTLEVSDVIIGGRAIKSELYNLKTQIQSFDDDSKRHFCAGLSELFLKNASTISSSELAILEELNPNFYSENPNFKKQFLQKVGEEFNTLRKNVNFWKGNVANLAGEDHELQGYFCEELSNALNKLEPTRAIDLKNTFRLIKLFNGVDLDQPLEFENAISNFAQNKANFAEDSTLKIEENLNNFNKKFAQSIVDFLTKVKDGDQAGKKEANDLIEDIRTKGSLELIREIKILLDQNLSRNGVTGTAAGIQVGNLQQTYSDLEGWRMQPLASGNQGGIILDDGSRLSSSQGVSKGDRQQSFLSQCSNLFCCIRSERENGVQPVASQSLAPNQVNLTEQPVLRNSMDGTASPSAQNIAVVGSLVIPTTSRS